MPNIVHSVIVTSFNSGSLLKEAILSVLDEMRGFGESHLFEVIVVDDASDDGDTRSVLSEIERSFSDVLLIRKKVNGGVSASRNAGAYYARGDWLSFLDGDDVWVEGRAQIFRKALEAYEDSNWISSDYSRMEFNGSILAGDPLRHQRISQLLEAKNGITTVSLPKPVAFAVESFLCHINSTMIKRSLFISVGGFDVDFRTAEDHDLWIRLSRVANLTYVKQLGSLYRINPKSITNTAKAPHPNLGAVYRKALIDCADDNLRETIKNRIHVIALQNIYFFRRNGYYKSSAREAFELLKVNPFSFVGWKQLCASILRLS